MPFQDQQQDKQTVYTYPHTHNHLPFLSFSHEHKYTISHYACKVRTQQPLPIGMFVCLSLFHLLANMCSTTGSNADQYMFGFPVQL